MQNLVAARPVREVAHGLALGLTYPQYLVLLALWGRDGQTVRELGEAVALDSGTLSPLLRRLEKAGRVSKERKDDDERLVRVTLTPSGRSLEPAAAVVRHRVEDATGLPHDAFFHLREQLFTLADTVDDAVTAGADSVAPYRTSGRLRR